MSTFSSIIAGFGGQGSLLMGKIMAYSGMLDNKKYLGVLLMVPKCVAVLQT